MKYNILYVDDEQSNLNAFKNLFRKKFNVITANSGQKGLEILEAQPLDLIITDQRMPEMTGIEFLKKVRAKRSNHKFILLTAFVDNDVIKEAINDVGIYWYVNKPFDPDQMEQNIINAIHAYHAEKKIWESESALNEAQDLSRIGSWSWEVEKNIVKWSDTMYDLVGWDKEKPPPNFEENIHVFDPESYEILGKAVERSLSFSEPYELDLIMVHRDGHSFNAMVRGKAVTDSTGKIIKLYGTVQDITDRKRAESEHDKLFKSSFDLICIAGFDGYFKEINPFWEQVTGYAIEELYAKPFIEFIHPDDLKKTSIEIQELLEGKKATIGFENRYITKSGKEIHLSWTATPFPQEKVMYCIARDITNRKMAEKKIVQYQQRLKDLTSELTISEEKIRKQIAIDLHDNVGQMLASMRMQMARITDMEENPELAIRMKSISQGLLKSIQGTRAAIFDLSSPQLNELGLAAATNDWMKKQIEEKHYIKTVFSGESEKFVLDENTQILLFRSLKELMINTVKHAKASHLTTTFKRKDNMLDMTIDDDGIGFNFNPDLLRLKSNSYGLFSIHERIIDLGGIIEVDSVIDKGTKIKLSIPLKDKSL